MGNPRMLNEKKCPVCGKWTDGSKMRCVFCGAPIDATLIAEERKKIRDAEASKKRLAEENRFERYLRELQESEKRGHKILFAVLNAVFTVYMAILSFFIWLIALISG